MQIVIRHRKDSVDVLDTEVMKEEVFSRRESCQNIAGFSDDIRIDTNVNLRYSYLNGLCIYGKINDSSGPIYMFNTVIDFELLLSRFDYLSYLVLTYHY